MNVLDHFETYKREYITNKFLKFGLILILVTGIGLLLDGIYSEFEIRRIIEEGILVCFLSPYRFRWLLQLISILGILISTYFIRSKGWVFPKRIDDIVILFSPIGLLIIDYLLVEFFY